MGLVPIQFRIFLCFVFGYLPQREQHGELLATVCRRCRKLMSFALHIENKKSKGKLEPGQAAAYSVRAKCWANNERYLNYLSAGLPTVIPGCERRTLPRSTTRVDESGRGLLHFYKPSSLREQLARRADAPLLPKRGQKVLPKSGLFVS